VTTASTSPALNEFTEGGGGGAGAVEPPPQEPSAIAATRTAQSRIAEKNESRSRAFLHRTS
jgi:hypothetical protein